MICNTIAEILDITHDRCLMCKKKFPDGVTLKKKSIVLPRSAIHADLIFSTVNRNVRFKLTNDVEVDHPLSFICRNDRHDHTISFRVYYNPFRVYYNPRRLIISNVVLESESINFRKDRRKYSATCDFKKKEMTFFDPGSGKIYSRPAIVRFIDREDMMNKIDGWTSLI